MGHLESLFMSPAERDNKIMEEELLKKIANLEQQKREVRQGKRIIGMWSLAAESGPGDVAERGRTDAVTAELDRKIADLKERLAALTRDKLSKN